MINVIIVDDEELAIERIKTLLEDKDDFYVAAECSDGKEAVEAITEHKPELVFLDIQMPGMNGFEVIENLDIHLPEIIFVTAFDQFAIKAFEVNAVDYLLKPFDKKRFEETLGRAKNKLYQKEENNLQNKLNSLMNFINTESQEKYLDKFIVKNRGKILIVPVKEVVFIKAEGNYIEIVTSSGKHLIRESISNIESKLNPEEFIRIHRSAIVKIKEVKELESHFNNEYFVVMKNGMKLKSSRNYKEEIDKVLLS